jgi:Divergent InlB B-repeat domain
MYFNDFRKGFSIFRNTVLKTMFSLLLLALAVLITPIVSQAQTAVVGSLANFDVLNNTGEETHGFEIQIEGISKVDIYRIFGNWGGTNVIRYGQGTATDYPGGVYVRWTSPYDPNTQTFAPGTPVPISLTTVPGESCWTLGMGNAYYSAGCEHFGISAYRNPTNTTYRWLVADPQNPGSLIPSTTTVSLPAPTWTVIAPAQVGNPPVVVAEIAAAPAAEPIFQYGDAQWVKVYKTENARELQLEELVGDNAAVVPEDAAHLEVSWNLIQHDPQQGGHKQKGRQVNQGNLGNGSRAVVRRYEYYKYAGVYNAVTHEALCGGDGTCSAPLDGELGDAVGAQNAAANVAVPSLTITKVGTGSVSSSDKVISCGSKCSSTYTLGTVLTLTAQPASNNIFTGWDGACTGAQLTCTVTVNDAINVNATFAAAPSGGGAAGGGGGNQTPQFTLSIGRSGLGTVTSNPAGIDCGKICSAKVNSGTTVTLSATPASGLRFINWSGACSGTAQTCSVTINKDTQVQANFAK